MKYILTLVLSTLLFTFSFAGTPQSMSYQAVIRDANNDLVMEQSIGINVSILQASESGTVVYSETQNPTSNQNGLVSMMIGTGATTYDFSTVDWSKGPYFIKTEIDITGGTTYTITSTSELLSVPYALHAETSADSKVLETRINELEARIEALEPIEIGDYKDGGIVYSLDETGKHGLVISIEDLNAGTSWDNAPTLASNYNAGGFNDWYIPTIEELRVIYDNLTLINSGAAAKDGAELSFSTYYWSSTEVDNINGYWLRMSDGVNAGGTKGHSYLARAIRAF